MRRDHQNPAEWHRWFAWHPVWIGYTRVWLEHVQRRWVSVGWGDGDWHYQFADTETQP